MQLAPKTKELLKGSFPMVSFLVLYTGFSIFERQCISKEMLMLTDMQLLLKDGSIIVS